MDRIEESSADSGEPEVERASSSSGVHPDEDRARRFLARDAATVDGVAELVKRIVGFRGFFIPAAERQDVVQEVLLQLWDAAGRPGFDPRGSFEAFVRTIAYRRCIDWRRARRPLEPLDPALPDGLTGPEAQLLARERILLGSRVLALLKESCRELIKLHVTQRLTYAEIARRLHRSEGALRVQMVECLGEARKVLARIRRRP